MTAQPRLIHSPSGDLAGALPTPTPLPPVKKPSSFLRYVHNFRCFAILMIVTGHLLDYLKWQDERVILFLSILIDNSSVYFVFIAGFLFQHLSAKYETQDYWKKKLQYVILPYVIVSLPAIALFLLQRPEMPPWFEYRYGNWATWQQVLALYFTGAQQGPFWFIPMIMLFYGIAPWLISLDRRPKLYWSLPGLLMISLIIHRPGSNENAVVSFIHFFSIYLLGMFVCHYKQRVLKVVSRTWGSLIAIVLMWIGIEMVITEPNTIVMLTSANTIEKAILCLVILFFLQRIDNKLPQSIHKTMSLIANLSFGIFFIHFYIIQMEHELIRHYLGESVWLLQANPATVLLHVVAVTGICIGILLGIKKVFGDKSRFIVGC